MKSLLLLLALTLSSTSYAINCRSVEILGNAGSAYILNEVNQEIAGFTQKLTKRKTLVIKRADSVSFNGCNAEMKILVSVKRKIRRNADGYILLTATVNEFNGRKVCLSNAKVKRVRLSHTATLGEAVYKLVANKALPNQTCFNL